jgi:predicted MPP superfamily phosphohydrolase
MKMRMVAALFLLTGLCSGEPSVSGTNTLRFGIVTDAHYADTETRGGRAYRDGLKLMRECVATMNQEKVDFLVELGDFKDQDNPPVEAKTLTYLKTIESEFVKFTGPRYHVLGNHDMDSLSKKAFLECVENTGMPKEKSYYAFVHNGVQFIVLDANFKRDGTPYDKGNFDWKDANIPKEEMEWLKKTLSEHTGKAIVFIHQRLDNDGAAICVRNAAEVRKLLAESKKVVAVFSGHDHPGAKTVMEGIPYYTLRWLTSGYAIVEVNSESCLTVKGFRRVASAELK